MKTTLVGMTTKQAQWLGMAASVAGGCVATGESASFAAAQLGWSGPEMIGRVPDSWLPSVDYVPLTAHQISTIRTTLGRKYSGWSGAERANQDNLATAKMLGL